MWKHFFCTHLELITHAVAFCFCPLGPLFRIVSSGFSTTLAWFYEEVFVAYFLTFTDCVLHSWYHTNSYSVKKKFFQVFSKVSLQVISHWEVWEDVGVVLICYLSFSHFINKTLSSNNCRLTLTNSWLRYHAELAYLLATVKTMPHFTTTKFSSKWAENSMKIHQH